MNNFTKEQLLNIIAAADEVLTALDGTNEDIHRDDDAKMCAAWDNLNDVAAPPEVVKQLAQSVLAVLTSEPVAPDGWRLVPVEPTRQMMSQGHFAMGGTDRGKFRRIYQAMLAAAPVITDSKTE